LIKAILAKDVCRNSSNAVKQYEVVVANPEKSRFKYSSQQDMVKQK